MRRWLLRRSALAVLTWVLAVLLLFFLMRLAPGDPLDRLTGDRPITPQEIAALRARYGLDQPLPRQFIAFVKGLARGDLGVSIQYGRSVTGLIVERLPATLLLGGAVLLINFTLGLWLGVQQAVHRGGPREPPALFESDVPLVSSAEYPSRPPNRHTAKY